MAFVTGKRIACVGGDARQLEMIRQFRAQGADVITFGFDRADLPGTAKGRFSPDALSGAEVLILPITGTDNEGHVKTAYAEDRLTLTREHLQALQPHALVITGMARPYLSWLCSESSTRLVCLLDQDEVAILNAIPTAEGALAVVMKETPFTVHSSRTLVVGFGRVGMTVARLFAQVGARVAVADRNRAKLARAREMGLSILPIGALREAVSDQQVVINTVPALVIDASVLDAMPKDVFLLDLASEPEGGTDFAYARRLGLHAQLAPSLPGLVAPQTAGQILADVAMRIITEDADGKP
ncbi:MAG: dipicolinate synthase subunit DpsA [Firmicutes bacterium]|nr:dipicolinate synthase subunit DpsA [Bacillota bacterium]